MGILLEVKKKMGILLGVRWGKICVGMDEGG